MTLKQLFHIYKVAECGSFSSAAEQLYLSQSTLSRSVAQLEQEYGFKIFVRNQFGVELTARGRDFLGYAKNILAATNSLNNAFLEKNSTCDSQLLIASQQIDCLYDVLHKTYTQIQSKDLSWNVIETDRYNIMHHVLNRVVNIGILVRSSLDNKTFQTYSKRERLETYVIDKSIVYVCFGPKSLLYRQNTITFSDVINCPQIALDVDRDSKKDFCFDYTPNFFNPNNLIFFNNIDACEYFLLKTDVLLFISKWTIGCLKDSRIRVVPVNFDSDINESPNTELVWTKRAGEALNATDRKFIYNLYQHFGKNMPENL